MTTVLTQNYIKAPSVCFYSKAGNLALDKKQWVIVKRGAPEACRPVTEKEKHGEQP